MRTLVLVALVAVVGYVALSTASLAVSAVGRAFDQRIAEIDCAASRTCEPTP